MDPLPFVPKLNGFSSADGQWWWDGQAWVPAISIEGARWTPSGPRSGSLAALRGESRSFKLILAAWVILLVTWVPLTFQSSDNAPSGLMAVLAFVAGALAMSGTIGLGSLLGYRQRWRYLGCMGLVGSLAIALVVFFTFESIQSATASDGPGVGIGAFFVSLAIALVAGVFLLMGALIGMLVRRYSGSRRNPIAPQ